jgi:hypothetical protein
MSVLFRKTEYAESVTRDAARLVHAIATGNGERPVLMANLSKSVRRGADRLSQDIIESLSCRRAE